MHLVLLMKLRYNILKSGIESEIKRNSYYAILSFNINILNKLESKKTLHIFSNIFSKSFHTVSVVIVFKHFVLAIYTVEQIQLRSAAYQYLTWVLTELHFTFNVQSFNHFSLSNLNIALRCVNVDLDSF